MSTEQQDRARAAFLAYRRTRAPEHLAEVFDLCAQELLLVAHHVARRGGSPEDLLQTTFLEAITHAEQYDARRPIAPWLCGILLNVARREDRARQRELAGWRLEAPAEEDPSELAHAREFVEALRDSIAALPGPQRDVLTLRLVHGLTPTQIAHALGHPVGSVKSWIHRGVEHLRLALPAGFVAVLSTLLAAETTLAMVRERVLESAGVPTGGAVPAATGAAASTAYGAGARVLLALSAIALVGALLWFATHATDGGATAEQANLETPATGAEGEHALTRTGDAVAEAPRDGSDARAGAAEAGLTIRVRSSDGAPAAIVLRVEPRHGADPELRSRIVRTDREGRGHLCDLEAGEYVLRPDRGAARVVSVPARGVAVDVELEGRRTLAGRVLDGSGAPIEGASVWLGRAASLNEGEVVARTDSAGAFELAWLPADRAVAVWADGFLPSALAAIGSWPERRVDVVLERTPRRIEGVAVDETGRPLRARVRVGAAIEPRWAVEHLGLHALVAPLTVDTDDDGRFSFASVPATGPVALLARSAGRRAHAQDVEDDRALVLRLAPGARWVGVLDAKDEELALRATAPVSDDGGAPDLLSWASWAAPHALVRGGAFELGGLPEGRVVLTAVSREGDVRRRELEVPAAGRVEWSPAPRAPMPVTGIVRTASGAHLGGARIEAFAPDGRKHVVVASALGELALEALAPHSSTFAVRGGWPSFEGLLEPRIEDDPSDGHIELVVRDEHAPRTLLDVTALDASGRPVEALILVREIDPTPIPGRPTADGRFEFGPLPRGDYLVQCDGELGPRIVHGPIAVRGEARVDAGVAHELEPGRLAVRFEGLEPEERVEVGASLCTADGRIGLTYFRLKNGEGTSLPMAPGRVRLVVSFPTSGVVLHDVEVLAGRRTELVLPRPRGRPVPLAMVDADPRASIRARVIWRRADGTTAASLSDGFRRNRPDGSRVRTWNLEPGRYDVEVETWDGSTRSVAVDVPATGAAPVVQVELWPR